MRTVPAEGGKAPDSTFRRVVLPAPLGPTMPIASPGRDREVDLIEDGQRTKALRESGASEKRIS